MKRFYFKTLMNQTENVISNRPEVLEINDYFNQIN